MKNIYLFSNEYIFFNQNLVYSGFCNSKLAKVLLWGQLNPRTWIQKLRDFQMNIGIAPIIMTTLKISVPYCKEIWVSISLNWFSYIRALVNLLTQPYEKKAARPLAWNQSTKSFSLFVSKRRSRRKMPFAFFSLLWPTTDRTRQNQVGLVLPLWLYLVACFISIRLTWSTKLDKTTLSLRLNFIIKHPTYRIDVAFK